MITVPEYFQRYIDSAIDLNKQPKICCPFHGEDTPSFSYSPEKGVWRCFGSCKIGGDVYKLHQKFRGFKTYNEAVENLHRELGVSLVKLGADPIYVDEKDVEFKVLLNKANRLSMTPDEWLELDDIMSQYPPSISDLEDLIERRSNGLHYNNTV